MNCRETGAHLVCLVQGSQRGHLVQPRVHGGGRGGGGRGQHYPPTAVRGQQLGHGVSARQPGQVGHGCTVQALELQGEEHTKHMIATSSMRTFPPRPYLSQI